MSNQLIFDEIETELAYQVRKWGTTADDSINRPTDWVTYISLHSTRWLPGGFAPYRRETLLSFRLQMIKVASLAVAAIKWTDRLLDGQNHRPDVLQEDSEA